MTLRKANEHRNAWFEGVQKCCLDESLFTVMERIVRAEVHRLVVVDEHDKVIGIISLSDILLYLVLRPSGEGVGGTDLSVRENVVRESEAAAAAAAAASSCANVGDNGNTTSNSDEQQQQLSAKEMTTHVASIDEEPETDEDDIGKATEAAVSATEVAATTEAAQDDLDEVVAATNTSELVIDEQEENGEAEANESINRSMPPTEPLQP